MNLSKIPIGKTARITGYAPFASPIEASQLKHYRQKCLCMGLTPGTVFKVLGVAPLGCPIEIEVRGYSLSLRAQESQVLICELF